MATFDSLAPEKKGREQTTLRSPVLQEESPLLLSLKNFSQQILILIRAWLLSIFN